MKKIIALIICISVLFSSCSNDKIFTDKDGNRELVETYGIFNYTNKNSNIKYQLSVCDVVLSIILCETIIVPLVCVGFYLYEPVERINELVVIKKAVK